MASGMTNYFETETLEWAVTTNAVTRPTVWYVALFSADPGEAGGGTELTGNGYARQSVDFTVVGDTADNDAIVTFTASGGAWSDVTAVGITDASSGGNLLYYDDAVSVTGIADGDSVEFAAGTGLLISHA